MRPTLHLKLKNKLIQLALSKPDLEPRADSEMAQSMT